MAPGFPLCLLHHRAMPNIGAYQPMEDLAWGSTGRGENVELMR